MTNRSEYRMPATLTQPPAVCRRIDEAWASGYVIIIGRDSREFDAAEAMEFGLSLLHLVQMFSPSTFEEWVKDGTWQKLENSFSGTVKESGNSSPEVTE